MARRGRKKTQRGLEISNRYSDLRRQLEEIQKKFEAMGIRYNKNPLPIVPKRITEASVRKLEKITEYNIATKGTILDEETNAVLNVTPKRLREITAQYEDANFVNALDLYKDEIQNMYRLVDAYNPQLVAQLKTTYEIGMEKWGSEEEFYRYLKQTNQEADFLRTFSAAFNYKEGSQNKATAIQKFEQILMKTPMTLEDSNRIGEAIEQASYGS